MEVMLAIIVIAVFNLVCFWALARSKQITDRQKRREESRSLTVEDLYRTYWRRRYPDNQWPGRTR